ncbi:diheme cytochrome c peroxidase [Malaciobacter marinus]|uniref:Diheme cytochrome c peroxidase n=1 Tax=Malaciobacter marinus TaxID=505249 RepID=A0A347TIV8_9BACT|nr:cytochrome c peroxidase [Malaciobacter marinus]AXX86536.1 diheme cytochrome c peroxidase [Malaciobacter marinus]PHO14196.1 methylamine utilization protein MauG [Malaciobacter marinus]
MRYLKMIGFSLIALIIAGCNQTPTMSKKELAKLQLEKEQLGKILFFDKNLSKNRTQNCATCHNPERGFADDRDNGVGKMASLGDDNKSLGDRQAPTASYAMFSPVFHYDKKNKKYKGGQFWDGREGTLAGQAGGPPLNPVEMGMPSKEAVVNRLKENEYYIQRFKEIYGEDIFKSNEKAFFAMTELIEAFEMTKEFAPFDSKYDRYLKGEYDLTVLEDLGRSIFFSNNNNSCANCHVLKGEDKKGETFTNYEYHNIGTPINHELRAKNGTTSIDNGLLNNPAVTDEKHKGKYKVPTLRNVAVTGPYMHNGVFKDLRTVVEFYDKYNNKDRKINPETGKPWQDPEVEETISLEDLKANKLIDRKVEALVAFMKLLTDKRYEHLLEENENK